MIQIEWYKEEYNPAYVTQKPKITIMLTKKSSSLEIPLFVCLKLFISNRANCFIRGINY
jgi:hypothetical protein